MPEEQKQEIKKEPVDPGYYKDTGSKVADFLVGFLGYPIIVLLAQLTMGDRLTFMRANEMGWLTSVLLLGLTIVFVVFAYKRGRKFIAIGILSLLIVPLIAAGSCLLIVMAVSH